MPAIDPEDLFAMFGGMKRAPEPINTDAPITSLPATKSFGLYSRVTLDPKAKGSKNSSVLREPDYGIIIHLTHSPQWITENGNPLLPVSSFDTIVATKLDDKLTLFPYHSSQLREANIDDIDIDEELDNYRIKEAKSFIVGDEVVADSDSIKYPIFPNRGVVVDIFPETIYVASNINHHIEAVDCVIRCIVSGSQCENYFMYSGTLISYADAMLRANIE